MIFDIYINCRWKWKPCQNDSSNQCTWVWNQVSTFLSLVNKDLTVKNTDCIYNKCSLSLKGYIFWRCNFVIVYTFLWGIHYIKNKEVEFLQNKSELAILIWRHEKRALKVKILHFEFLLQVASPTFSLSKNMKSLSLK